MSSFVAGVAGIPAPCAVGHVAALLQPARDNSPVALPGARQTLHVCAFPPRHLPHGLLALHAAL